MVKDTNHTESLIEINLDFDNPKFIRRTKDLSIRTSELARAINIKSKPVVLDATAGLGRDSFVLASLGCKVIGLERNAEVFNKLRDAYNISENVQLLNLKFENVDFFNINLTELKRLFDAQLPDVIYLDPMFPERSKSALVKKEAQWLKAVVGHDLDCDQLLIRAKEFKPKRIVVKRAKLAPWLADLEPNHSVKGKSVRFDVYLST